MKLVLFSLLLAAPAMAEPLRVVRVSPFDGVCAVTKTGTIVCEKERALPSLDLVARDYVPAYHPVVVRDDGTVVRVKSRGYAEERIKPDLIPTPFEVTRAGLAGSARSDQLCVLGKKGELACGPFDHSVLKTKITFTQYANRFTDVTFANDVVWAIDDRGALWCIGAYNCARIHAARKAAPSASLLELGKSWPDPLKHDKLGDAPFHRVTDGVKRIYGAGEPCLERAADPKTLVCWSFTRGPEVFPRPEGDELASIGSLACARTGDSITCTMLGNKLHKPFTVTAKDAAKMHSGEGRVCVETKTGELRCAKTGNPMPPFETVSWATKKSP